MKGNKLIVPFLLILFSKSYGQNKEFPFRLSPKTDLTISGANMAMAGLNLLFRSCLNVPEPDQILLLDRGNLFIIDRVTYRAYNPSIERLSHYAMLSTLSLPLLLAPLCHTGCDVVTLGIIGLETYLTTYMTIQTLKYLTRRPRPAMYSDDYNIAEYKGIQSLNSFPSGHTALAFSAAGFIHACYSIFLPKNRMYSILKYSTYAAAATAGFFRYYSGVHHLSDVLAGAAIGMTFGFIIPRLHSKSNADRKISLTLDPFPHRSLSVLLKF